MMVVYFVRLEAKAGWSEHDSHLLSTFSKLGVSQKQIPRTKGIETIFVITKEEGGLLFCVKKKKNDTRRGKKKQGLCVLLV